MPLQTRNLVMIGLGTQGDTPPNNLQPPLKDGIHLRWAFERTLGFPWYGFYLFRRLHREGKLLCLHDYLRDRTQPGATPGQLLPTPIGTLSSDRELVLTDDFSPAGFPEFDLAGRRYLRFEFPPGDPARRVEAHIGFRRRGGEGLECADFRGRQRLVGRNPWIEDGIHFEAFDHAGNPEGSARIDAWGGLSGLNCSFRLEIKLPQPVSLVELTLSHFSSAPVVEAFEDTGASAGAVQVTSPQGQPETVRISGQAITNVVVRADQNEALLHALCYGTRERAEPTRERTVIRMTALVGSAPVASVEVAGAPGAVVSAALEADWITAVELSSGPAALVDLCYVPLFQDVTDGWEPVPDCPQPICLPVEHADYPCPGKPATAVAAEHLAAGRVCYGDPNDWRGAPFSQLRSQLVQLVQGGPPPGGQPMADRSTNLGAAPRMRDQRPLDWVLISSLSPAVAQMTGLYWLDGTVDPAEAYDYLLVADYTDQFRGDPLNVLRWLGHGGGAVVDGYIVFNKRMAPAAPLAPPTGLRAHALPGGTVNTGALLQDASNNVGLTWETGVIGAGVLLPDHAVMYHAWRTDLGLPEPAAPPPDGDYKHISQQPVVVAQERLPAGAAPQRGSDWPPFRLHFIDRGLPDGWYSYKANGVDIFGRHSARGAPCAWYQWAPMPEPRPWYYQDPPGDRSIKAFAVQVLDKVPPPPPAAVEAFALDPDDPYIQRDAAYNSWFATLNAAERTSVVGLRVKWEWTWEQMRQAPDVAEFRIYYNPGTDPPAPDHSVTTNWDRRFHVVGYNQDVTVTTDANGNPLRRYEVFLPAPGAADRSGLPLVTSQASPIAYAHIGVSAADDKTHTLDNPIWAAGSWGNRPGNEGRIGMAVKVFRVHRQPPGPPPVPPPDSDRVYATPADYHGRSFYTYRWIPAANLKTHVFRAVEDAVFKADWRLRPRPALNPNTNAADRALFPGEAEEPAWNNLKRQQVADALNALNAFPHTTAGTAQAMAHYSGLTNDALRVLAGLPGTERAFTQLTIQPLDPAAPVNANRVGPDNPPGFPVDPALRAYVDTLDGRSTSRSFYRSAYVDGAQNRGPLGAASVPIYLPRVTPPRTPRVTRVAGGDRQVTLSWASNREPDLAEYRVHRTDDELRARDIRLMTVVHTAAVPAGDPAARPAQVDWTDTPVAGLVTYHYRLSAVDSAGNASPPSDVVSGRAFDDSRPDHPAWDPVTPGPAPNSVVLAWTSPIADLRSLVQRRQAGAALWDNASPWLARGLYAYTDEDRTPGVQYEYRLRVMDASGKTNNTHVELTA